MIKILVQSTLVAGLLAACASPPPRPVAVAETVPSKRIIRTGAELVLPDGSRVTPDSTGGFLLPNGDYVRRERGALLLPTGARCAPDAAGYVCP